MRATATQRSVGDDGSPAERTASAPATRERSRSTRDPSSLTRETQQKIWAIDSALPTTTVMSMNAVVAKTLSPQRFNLVRIESQLFGQLNRIDLHPAGMPGHGLILGFDRQGKDFDGAAMERGYLFGVGARLLGLLLFVFQAIHVLAVGAVDDIEDGQEQ